MAFFEVQNFRRTAGRDRLMFDNDLIEQLAEQLHRSPQTIYNRLNLIRRELFECVEDAVRQQGTKQ